MVVPVIAGMVALGITPEFTAVSTAALALAARFGNRAYPLAQRLSAFFLNSASDLPYLPNVSNTVGRIQSAAGKIMSAVAQTPDDIPTAGITITPFAPLTSQRLSPSCD